MVQRFYPRILDVLGDLGGILQVIFFFVAMCLRLYHSVGHEQILLNQALLQIDEEEIEHSLKIRKLATRSLGQGKGNQSQKIISFSFAEIAKFKFFCCRDKTQERYLRYKELISNLSRRLDFAEILETHGKVSLLSHVFLEPYQMKIVSLHKRCAKDKSAAAERMSIQEAFDKLYKNIEEKQGSELQAKIDAVLMQLMLEDQTMDYLSPGKTNTELSRE